mmetsp:Transcript_196/g.1401  ORF Transcript_196/g.1401 Transcript_196/m.1401 type:complete len:286 (-) Transcript_196:1061-1918(-)
MDGCERRLRGSRGDVQGHFQAFERQIDHTRLRVRLVWRMERPGAPPRARTRLSFVHRQKLDAQTVTKAKVVAWKTKLDVACGCLQCDGETVLRPRAEDVWRGCAALPATHVRRVESRFGNAPLFQEARVESARLLDDRLARFRCNLQRYGDGLRVGDSHLHRNVALRTCVLFRCADRFRWRVLLRRLLPGHFSLLFCLVVLLLLQERLGGLGTVAGHGGNLHPNLVKRSDHIDGVHQTLLLLLLGLLAFLPTFGRGQAQHQAVVLFLALLQHHAFQHGLHLGDLA